MEVGTEVVYKVNKDMHYATVCTQEDIETERLQPITLLFGSDSYIPIRFHTLHDDFYCWYCPKDHITPRSARIVGNELILE